MCTQNAPQWPYSSTNPVGSGTHWVLVVAIHVLTGLSSAQQFIFTKEQLDAMPSHERAYFDRNCPKNEEWKRCKDNSIPDCSDPRPLLRYVHADCRAGCQCKKGFIISSAGCVRDCSQGKDCFFDLKIMLRSYEQHIWTQRSKLNPNICVSSQEANLKNCPRPNEIRSKCIPRPECQRTCFPPTETPILTQLKRIYESTNGCDKEPCIPFECECQKGYIRLHSTPGKIRCIPLATCKKLKDQYGSSLPSGFDVTVLSNK